MLNGLPSNLKFNNKKNNEENSFQLFPLALKLDDCEICVFVVDFFLLSICNPEFRRNTLIMVSFIKLKNITYLFF